jgi:WhiB family transcriptional regulator, redox-sensing transcriptional regulator
VLTTARPHPVRYVPGELSDSNLASLVYRYGRCASSRIDPDLWFPVANDVVVAREEAADAIAVCFTCPVRAECLEYSLRHASDFGVYGVWGGMVAGERRLLRPLGGSHQATKQRSGSRPSGGTPPIPPGSCTSGAKAPHRPRPEGPVSEKWLSMTST